MTNSCEFYDDDVIATSFIKLNMPMSPLKSSCDEQLAVIVFL